MLLDETTAFGNRESDESGMTSPDFGRVWDQVFALLPLGWRPRWADEATREQDRIKRLPEAGHRHLIG